MSEKISTRKLYLVVFLTGAIGMVLELIGSRILAPFLGTSTFVWSALIGVILGAMSLGYYIGGRLADKNPNLRIFSFIIFISGIFVFMIIMFKSNILGVSYFLGIRLGSVFASIFLFAMPAFLLGMVSPYAVRLDMERVESSGKTVGNLYAMSTFGSIVGTFSAGFYLIPNFGSTNILYGLAIALFLVSLLCYDSKKRKLEVAVFLVTLTAFSAKVEAMNNKGYLVEKDSEYSHICVYDTVNEEGKGIRVMSVASFFDSSIYLDSDETAFRYPNFYMLDDAFAGQVDRAVLFGGAAYSVPKAFLKRNESGTIDVVEIDPETTEIAKQYFNLKDDERLNIFHEDARIFLNDVQDKKAGEYDVVYNDAFSSSCSIPFHLTTVEAVRKIYNILDDDGVYMINIISAFEGENSIFLRSEYKTIKSVFGNIYLFKVDEDASPESAQNFMLVATKQKMDINEIINDNPDGKVAELLKGYVEENINTEGVIILTDDFAPVSYYTESICRG